MPKIDRPSRSTPLHVRALYSCSYTVPNQSLHATPANLLTKERAPWDTRVAEPLPPRDALQGRVADALALAARAALLLLSLPLLLLLGADRDNGVRPCLLVLVPPLNLHRTAPAMGCRCCCCWARPPEREQGTKK
jgi:hypothetical protein